MKNTLTFTAILVFTLFSNSQELDETYLDSLPLDAREEISQKIKAKEFIEEPIYRRASSKIDKEFPEEDINAVFGAKLFDTIQTSFMPVNEPNLDASYILDFGDVLEIQIIGQKDSINSYSIERDGSINLPEIGKIILSGQSLADATAFVKAKIKNAYIGSEAFVSLKSIRDINILVAGNAYNPGIYTLNGNSSILHALSVAGGVDSIGGYRNINLIREGKIIETLDLYNTLIFGINNFSTGLRSGDSIVVNPLQKVISIESGVLRPARYELKDDDTFEDILRFANGYSNYADLSNIIVKRITNGISSIIKIDYDQIDSFEFKNNDSLFIREFKFNTVVLQGSVKNPGTYRIQLGSTLSDLIKDAGGYDQTAYPFGGYLQNLKALEINKNAKEKLYQVFLNNLVQNSVSFTPDSSNLSILQQIYDSKPTGRVIAEFDLDLIAINKDLDTILEDGDKILIPNITQQVYVQGEVSNPGASRYLPGKDISYYIRTSGGFLDNADSKNIFVIHPNGETKNLNSASRLSFILPEDNLNLIYPGSIIYVPSSTDFTTGLQVASIWAPIISSVALSLTSLSVLNNN